MQLSIYMSLKSQVRYHCATRAGCTSALLMNNDSAEIPWCYFARDAVHHSHTCLTSASRWYRTNILWIFSPVLRPRKLERQMRYFYIPTTAIGSHRKHTKKEIVNTHISHELTNVSWQGGIRTHSPRRDQIYASSEN